MATPAWKKSKQKEESTMYLDEDEDDIAAMFFAAGGGKPKSEKSTNNGGGAKNDDNDDDSSTSTDEGDAAALYFAEQEAKAKEDASSDSDSSSGSSKEDSSIDSSSGNSRKSGSSSSAGSSSQRNDDNASQSSGGSSSSGSSQNRSGGSASEEEEDEQSSDSSDGSSRSDDDDDDDRSRSSTSRSGGDDDESRSRSSRSDSGDEGSRSSRSSRSSASSDSSSRSRSNSATSRSSDSDASSRSSGSDSRSKASGDAGSQGSDASSYEEVEVSSDSEDETKEENKSESKDNEKNESADKSSAPPPAKFPKPVNTTPAKSFPKVETSTTTPVNKAPDVKAKPAFVKSEDGLAPWQSELKKRKETGSKVSGWKKPKKEESTIYVDDEEEDDIAAMFFEAGGGKPESAKFQFGGGGAESNTSSGNDEDAAAMFKAAGQTDDEDAAAMFQAAGQTNDDDDAAAMFHAAGQTEATSENITPQTGSEELQTPIDSGETVTVVEVALHEHAGEILDVIEEEIEEIEEIEEEIIVETVDEDGEIIVEEFYDDEETVGASNEEEAAAILAAQLAEQQAYEEEQRALEELRLARQRALEEMERVESQMRNYIASLNNEEAARSVHSDQSSVPWAISTISDHEPTAVYGRYIQSARERRMDDQSSYFRPDMEIPTDDSFAETETFASSEQRSIPWDLEIRENDSWANPVRRLQKSRKTEVVRQATEQKVNDTGTNTNASMLPLASSTKLQGSKTVSSMSRKTQNKRKRRIPTGFREMVSAEVYNTSVPDVQRETELWYHPGFAFLSQNPSARPYFPPPITASQSRSFNGSDGTEKAIVSDLEIAEHVYNASVPAMTNKVTLLAFAEKMSNQWNLLESPKRSDDQSSSSGKESSEYKLPDLAKTIMRTASPWTKGGDNESTSSGSMSYDMLKPFEDETSDEEKQKNVVFSRSGSSVSIDLDVTTFEYEYIPERSVADSEASTITDSESVKSTRPPCGVYGFMSCCFFLVLVPASVAVFFLVSQQTNNTTPTTASNTNITFPTLAPALAPTLAPTLLNDTTTIGEEPTDAPSSAGSFTPTMQPTLSVPDVPEEPVTEDLLFRLLASASVDNGKALRNRQSPQFAAMEWLRTPNGFSGVSNDAIFLQRYAMATLYYSTAGESWTTNDGWLSDANVCDWFSSVGTVLCDNDGMVTAITLTNNGLNGNLPKEIGILSQLEGIMLSGNPRLTGPVPSALGQLSNLRSIFIEGTGLSSVPQEICYLPLLQDFWANCEQIGCTCCNECFF